MKRFLISFATPEYYRSQDVLFETAAPFFDGGAKYRDSNLSPEIYKLAREHFKYARGFGFWVWKPFILRDALRQVGDGDLVFYVDSGNEIIASPQPLFDIAEESPSGIVLFDNRDSEPHGDVWKNGMWTRGDCFRLMDCCGKAYAQGCQVDAAYICLRKSEQSIAFVDEYLFYCLDLQIVSDAANKFQPNLPEFRDHRHDQSVLSLLAIRHGVPLFREPSEWGNRAVHASTYPQIFDHHRSRYRGSVSRWKSRHPLTQLWWSRVARRLVSLNDQASPPLLREWS
jgi:hypothetical protein